MKAKSNPIKESQVSKSPKSATPIEIEHAGIFKRLESMPAVKSALLNDLRQIKIELGAALAQDVPDPSYIAQIRAAVARKTEMLEDRELATVALETRLEDIYAKAPSEASRRYAALEAAANRELENIMSEWLAWFEQGASLGKRFAAVALASHNPVVLAAAFQTKIVDPRTGLDALEVTRHVDTDAAEHWFTSDSEAGAIWGRLSVLRSASDAANHLRDGYAAAHEREKKAKAARVAEGARRGLHVVAGAAA